MNKISLSRKEQYLINVERLLSCIGMLKNRLDSMDPEWYPEELRSSIEHFAYSDMHNIVSTLVTWIEDNVVEEVD